MDKTSFVRQIYCDFKSLKTKLSTDEYQYCETILQTMIYPTTPEVSGNPEIRETRRKIYQFIAKNGKEQYSSYDDYLRFISSVKKMSYYW